MGAVDEEDAGGVSAVAEGGEVDGAAGEALPGSEKVVDNESEPACGVLLAGVVGVVEAGAVVGDAPVAPDSGDARWGLRGDGGEGVEELGHVGVAGVVLAAVVKGEGDGLAVGVLDVLEPDGVPLYVGRGAELLEVARLGTRERGRDDEVPHDDGG